MDQPASTEQTEPKLKRKCVHGPKEKRPRAGADGLTIRERRFVAEFVKTVLETQGRGNATKAAIAAGCPAASASTRGSNFLRMPHVKSAIEAHIDMHYAAHDITVERILLELRSMAFTGMSKFARIDSNGGLYMDFTGATEEELDALTELTTEEYKEGRGESSRTVLKTRVKMDKTRALELLGKYRKMWTDKTELAGAGGEPLVAPPLHVHFVTPEPKKD